MKIFIQLLIAGLLMASCDLYPKPKNVECECECTAEPGLLTLEACPPVNVTNNYTITASGGGATVCWDGCVESEYGPVCREGDL